MKGPFRGDNLRMHAERHLADLKVEGKDNSPAACFTVARASGLRGRILGGQLDFGAAQERMRRERIVAQRLMQYPLSRKLEFEEALVMWTASSFSSFAGIENPFLRMLIGRELPSRTTLSRMMRRHAALLLKEVVACKFVARSEHALFASLAMDAGTIWRRYFVTVLHAGGRPARLEVRVARNREASAESFSRDKRCAATCRSPT